MRKRYQRGFWQYAIPAAVTALSAYMGKKGQEQTNESNVALGREQMDFQERMSSSSWQRGTADMAKAGINPMLAFSQGGATSPSGAMPQVQNKWAAGINSAQSASAAGSSVAAMSMNTAQRELIEAQTEKLRSETVEQSLNSALVLAQGQAARAGAYKTAEETLGASAASYRLAQESGYRGAGLEDKPPKEDSLFAADVRKRKAEAKAAEYGLEESKATSEFWNKQGENVPYIRFLFEALRALTSATRR